MRTRDDDNVYGDSNYDLILSDWKDVGGGAKRAHTLSFQLNGVEVQRLTLKQVTLDPPIPPDTFAVSEEVKAKAKTAASEAPHQWVLRCIFLGCFLDSDKNTTRRTAASSWSSCRRIFSTWSAAPPTT